MKNKYILLISVALFCMDLESSAQNTIGVTPISIGGSSYRGDNQSILTNWGVFYDRNIKNSAWTWSTSVNYYQDVRDGRDPNNLQSYDYYRRSSFMIGSGMRYDFLHNRDKKWQLYLEPGIFFDYSNFNLKIVSVANGINSNWDAQRIHTGFMLRTGVDFNLSSRFTLGYQFSVLTGPIFVQDNTAANPSMNYYKIYRGVPNYGLLRIGYRFK